jgi:hypothetical protein
MIFVRTIVRSISKNTLLVSRKKILPSDFRDQITFDGCENCFLRTLNEPFRVISKNPQSNKLKPTPIKHGEFLGNQRDAYASHLVE